MTAVISERDEAFATVLWGPEDTAKMRGYTNVSSRVAVSLGRYRF